MSYIKRACTSLLRGSGKALILIGLTLLLSTFVIGAIIIHQAIHQTALRMQQGMPTAVTARIESELFVDFPVDQEFPEFELITLEIANQIATLPYVSHFDYSRATSPNSTLMTYVPEIDNANIDTTGSYTNFFWLNGVSRPEVIFIEDGLFDLIDGRVFTEDEMNHSLEDHSPTPILIPNVIAELNDLAIGSSFNLYMPHFMLPDGADVPESGLVIDPDEIHNHPYNNWIPSPYEFQVIGIMDVDYNIATHLENLEMQRVIYNTVFIPNWKVELMIRNQHETGYVWEEVFSQERAHTIEAMLMPTIFWVLEDPSELEYFIEAALPLLPEYYTIDAWTQIFDPMESTLGNLRGLANQILWFGVGASLILLTLLISLYLRDRHHEMGIYLALGEKKSKIVRQILLEVLVVSLIGMSLAIFTGNILSDQVSQYLLRQELTQDTVWQTGSTFIGEWQQFSQLEFFGFGRELTLDELLEFFEIGINTQAIAIFYAVGTLTVVLATIVPVRNVLKLDVKEVLMQANIG
ncbi:MAG: ABC transporter permease [Turicibacter sp.]|nr:ABC transporter permease [Turicibacter sp.]